ncbi:MAG TPA: TaqI-like C-terminal specificity domain-containing protein, partial [Chitinophagales bacterium]|nr:TaqI-like C-terminal specificity domain-containing protein [Chitinophagales bacterium]
FEWRFEFPEVLNDDGDFVGFDVVIGNPPYIPLEAFEINERKFFNSKYAQLERKYETSVPFILEGLKILNNKGLLAYIAPVTWQTGENYSKFRNYFFEQYGLVKLINLPFNIFEDAYVDTALYFVSKEPKPEYLIFAFDKKVRIETLENLEYNKFQVSEIKAPDFKLIIDKTAHKFSRFDSEYFVPFGTITKSTQGLSGSNFPETNNIETEYLFPFLSKGNVYNFCLVKDSIYNTDLVDKKNLVQFYQAEPKILIRRIISRQDRLSVTYCDEKLVFKKDINPFIPTDDNFDCYFLTGIIASKLISYIYLNSSSIATKDDFRQTTLTELRKLPIPNIDTKNQIPISDIVKKILNLKSENSNSDTTNLENQIDQLVYQLYDLTEDEINIIENT